jgi:hypothetical protein
MNYSNSEVREQFKQFRTEHFEPSIRVIAENIGTAYNHLLLFKNNKIDLGQKTLVKLVQFMQENQLK